MLEFLAAVVERFSNVLQGKLQNHLCVCFKTDMVFLCFDLGSLKWIFEKDKQFD